MDTNNIVNPAPRQPDFAQRMHHSKALIAIVAVLGVTVMALAAALVVNRTEAQPGGEQAAGSYSTPSTAQKLAADTPRTTSVPVKPKPAPVVVAQNQPRANVCSTCATVQSVTPVQRQGQVNGMNVGNTTIGLGTVAGGVVGGLLGNQVGGGNGKTAMTVLGVAGGAFAGNQIEKNMKKVTVYQVQLRMDDGSSRTMEISSAVPVGSRVVVEGKNIRVT